MDYRKAWDEITDYLERGVEEGEACGYNNASDTRDSGLYEAYKRVLDLMRLLESKIPENIKVGDFVRVTDSAQIYPAFSEWIAKNIENPFLIVKWAKYSVLPKGASGIVRHIAPHGTQDRDLAYVEVGKSCFIVTLDSLEKIGEA